MTDFTINDMFNHKENKGWNIENTKFIGLCCVNGLNTVFFAYNMISLLEKCEKHDITKKQLAIFEINQVLW